MGHSSRPMGVSNEAKEIAAKVEKFVREKIAPLESQTERDGHGPTQAFIDKMREMARQEGLVTPHIMADGTHFNHRETAIILRASGISPLGPLAVNTFAPDEGNMFLLGAVGNEYIKEKYLKPMVEGRARSAFFMTEPASLNGAGADPNMMITTCKPDGNHWVINGNKAFSTGAEGANFAIVMAKSDDGACMFLVDLPDPAIQIVRVPHTIDSSMVGGHAVIKIENLRVPADQMLGESGEGFKYAQVRLAPARLTHCMRWLGSCTRAHEIAVNYANRRMAFGKKLIEHEGVSFMLADNLIDLKQAELMIDWCADVMDAGGRGTTESSIAKVAVSEALFRIADRCVQVMGGTGVTDDTIVEQVFREVRAFRIYDGPSEVHRWSLGNKIKREWEKANS